KLTPLSWIWCPTFVGQFTPGAFVLLVGRARFEFATNGLKDLRIVSNSNQNIKLNPSRKYRDIGG
ncbi:hypothetical protein, partial [Polynucleobacter sp.]